MKIVILDGFTANPGDLSWERIEALGELTNYDRTEPTAEEILARARGAQVVMTNKVPLDAEILEELSDNLKYVGILATGYNVVDVEAARRLGVVVTNVPGYSTMSVVQHTLALLLEVTNAVGEHSAGVYHGEWEKSVDFSYTKGTLIELAGKTLGLVGFGDIGKAVARVAGALGMEVLAYRGENKSPYTTDLATWASLDELLERSDVISLHCPLTPETKGMINEETIGKMKKTAIFINTARGGCVDESALASALNNGDIAAAAIDVVEEEPIRGDNPLLKAKNCIITPHIAWAPKEARKRLLDIVADNLESYLEGKPKNVVS